MDFPVFKNTKTEVNKDRTIMVEEDIRRFLITDPYNYEYFSGQKVDRAHPMRKWFMILPLDKDSVIISYGNVAVHSKAYGTDLPSWVSDMRPYRQCPLHYRFPG